MAGSYRHVVDKDGEFIGVELIDNLGDAYEALEEMYDMIQHLSRGDRVQIHEAWRTGHYAKRMPERLAEEPQMFSYDQFWSE
jgi:hypothetical protein